jgi:DNA-binding NarL/FixJ family response regulator
MTQINSISPVLDKGFDGDFIVSPSDMKSYYQKPISQPEKVKRDYSPIKSQVEALTKYGTKSSAIRALKEEGRSTSEIADMLNIRYQHVRNVLNQIVKKK